LVSLEKKKDTAEKNILTGGTETKTSLIESARAGGGQQIRGGLGTRGRRFKKKRHHKESLLGEGK